MKKLPNTIAGIAAAILFVAGSTSANGGTSTYNLSAGFSPTSNPNGPWAYGWTPTIGGAFTALTVPWVSGSDSGATIPSWQLTSVNTPAVYKNTSDQTVTVGGGLASFPAGTVWFYPGDLGQVENYGVIRFTVPAGKGGRYQINADVSPVYPSFPQGDTDFHILANGSEVFGRFLAPGASATFQDSIRLRDGDTIEFVIGRGADNDSFGSGLRIAAILTAFGNDDDDDDNGPPQAQITLAGGFSAASNPNGSWAYGWSGTIGGAFTALTTPWISSVDGGVPIPSWQLTTFQTPAVYKNTSGGTVTVGGGLASFPAETVWFYPGEDGRPENYGVIRYTVPNNLGRKYRLQVDVSPVYPSYPQGDTDFHIVHNGTEIFGRFLAPSDIASFRNTLKVRSGDTIDFVIGRGADGSAFGSGLRIAATLTVRAGNQE